MKRILYLYMIFLVASACSDSGEGVAEVTLEVREFVEQEIFTFGEEQGIYLWSAKKWADKGISHVEYVLDSTLLNEFNKKEKMNLKMLPTSCYRVEQTVFQVSDDDKFAKFKVTCSPEKILELGGTPGELKYALPYRIIVNGSPVEERYGTVIVGIRVLHPYISISAPTDSVKVSSTVSSVQVPIEYNVNFDNIWWINLNFKIDQEKVTAYNQRHGTRYRPFPADKVTWVEDEVTLERGKNSGKFAISVNTEALEKKSYLLPFELSDVSDNRLMIDPDQNIQYIIFDNKPPLWSVTTCKTWQGPAENMIDGVVSETSRWVFAGEAPVWFVTLYLSDQSNLYEFSGIDMYTLQGYWGSSYKGQKSADIYVSMDGENWTKVYSDYQFQIVDNHFYNGKQTITFPPTEGRYIKILMTEKYDNYVGFSEVTPIGKLLTE